MDPQTELEMSRAQEMRQFVSEQLVGKYPNDDDDRRALFASFLSFAQSHHEAIMVLCHQRHLIGSAYALLRPLVEVTNRGLFVGFLATPAQISERCETIAPPVIGTSIVCGGFLVTTKRNDGINPRRTASGNIAGKQCNACKQERDRTPGGRVAGANLE